MRRPFFFLLVDSWVVSAEGAVVVLLAGCTEVGSLEELLSAGCAVSDVARGAFELAGAVSGVAVAGC